jgi:multidrug efflux pump subunit AcrA (membrane-fusion protein)
MALKARISKEDYEKLHELLKGEYKVSESDANAYVLDAEGVEDVTGLKSALKSEREARAAAERNAKAFEGLDPAKAKEALAAQQQAEEDKAKAEGRWTDLKLQLNKQHELETKALNEKLSAKDSAITKYLVDQAATAALAAAKVKSLKVLLPHIKSQVKVQFDEGSGEYKAVVVDAKGEPRIGNAKGEFMTIPELVEELKADSDFAVNFEASGITGGGAAKGKQSSNAGGGKTISRSDKAAMNANLDAIADGTVTVVD